ncbi:MAG: glycosyltransferase family 39 protein [Paludisphaera borealis]|uniref:ArnT family glycosyltransferase n=1 Tax=Paludisphaera borealis TaxID=1387353 RepID=UPI00284F7E01|nr:glycosyltransferase family 39 protein [Paludisphaera borealis]MDR3620342.1 glycosyltransferase family 39 protein [Paludisphaera borealis]
MSTIERLPAHKSGVASRTPPGFFQRSGWPLIVLGLLELAWLGWFLCEPLPNAPSPRGAITRGILLLDTFPGVVPDVSFRESLLGKGLDELSHVENLPQRLPIAAAAGLIVLAALGLGDLIRRRLSADLDAGIGERLALDFGLGTVALALAALLLGRLGLLHPWVFRVGLGVVAVAGVAGSRFWKWERPRFETGTAVAVLIVAPFLVLMLLGAMLPAVDFDVLEYHLQGPKEYFQNGRIAFLPHNVYTSMPFGVEMLHLIGMEVMGDWWWGGLVGQLLVALYAPMAAVLIAGSASRLGSRWAGRFAAIVYLTTPWIYRLGVIAYVEGPLCYFQAALLWTLIRGWNDERAPRGRFWGLLGLLAGGAMTCKYTAVLSAVIPWGVFSVADAVRRRSARPVLAFVLGWSVVMAPWMIKNVIDTGNPVYPLAWKVFGGRDWTPAREAQWSHAHGPRPITSAHFWHSVVEVAGRSDWQSPLYLAFAPLAFLKPRSRKPALLLGGYLVYGFLTWWLLTHRLDRFWLPMLPAAAVLAGLGADWSETMAWRIIRAGVFGLAIATNLAYSSTALAGLNEWTGDIEFLRRDMPRRLNAPLATTDARLPADAKILLVGQAAVYHLNHPILYNTVFNTETIEVLAGDRPPQEVRRVLHDRGVTHVYVDWKEIMRHRDPSGYGFTDYVTPQRFAAWIAAGILGPPTAMGMEQDLYEVR